MSSQNIDIEEPFIDDTINEDYTTKGAYNAIYNLVLNQVNDQDDMEDPQTKTASSFLPNETDFNEEGPPPISDILFSRNEGENSTEQTQKMINIHKSREIHRQLINRKNRWKPSEIELAILKLHFGKNKYPSKEEKEGILKNLEQNFGSTIQMGQLNRWFQHEREKSQKNGYKNMSKNTYKKFGKEELDYLKENFVKNNYPKTEEMMQIAKRFGVTLSKIENWYKHNRRALAKKGDFILKTKKYFKREEVNYLLKMFAEHPRPTKEQIAEMADHLICSELQIKNWYSNKRKKQKIVAKKQAFESQETQFHQAGVPFFPQVVPQSYESFTPSSINPVTPTIPATLPQSTETTGLVPNMFPMRPISTIPIQQVQSVSGAYTNGVIANNQYLTGVNSNGMYSNGSMPILIIPAASLNQTQPLTIGQNANTSNSNGFLQAQDIQQQQSLLFRNDQGKNMINPTMSPLNNGFPQAMGQQSFANLLPNNGFVKQNGFNADMSGGNWMPQNPTFQSSTPIFVIPGGAKQQGLQNPQMAFAMQNQPNTFTNINPTNLTGGNFVPVSFVPNNGNMQGLVPHEQPMQIQYLTNLYCPYSNNNIFSTYYPVVLQNGSNYNVQAGGKPAFGMDNMIPSATMVSNPQMMSNNMGSFGSGMYRESENSNDQRFFQNKN